MTKPFILDPQDRVLFRQAVGPVKPLRCDRIEPVYFHPAPVPRFTEADERQTLADMMSNYFEPADMDTGEELLESLYPSAAVAEARTAWRARILAGEHLIPGLGRVDFPEEVV